MSRHMMGRVQYHQMSHAEEMGLKSANGHVLFEWPYIFDQITKVKKKSPWFQWFDSWLKTDIPREGKAISVMSNWQRWLERKKN